MNSFFFFINDSTSPYDLEKDFKDYEFTAEVALVPIKNLVIDKKFGIKGKFILYPPNTINDSSLMKNTVDFRFDYIQSEFLNSVIIAIPIETRDIQLSGSLANHADTICKYSFCRAEEIMNIFRYIYLNIDKASCLPEPAGLFSSDKNGMILYNNNGIFLTTLHQNIHFLICNPLIIKFDEINKQTVRIYFTPLLYDSVISNVIKHAYRLYSEILYSYSATNKFMLSMTLIEYLGNPFEYKRMKDSKTLIASLSSNSRNQYHYICERFKKLTSLNENGNQVGFRTNIIHNGKLLEELVSHPYETDLVLREVQGYICNYIKHLLNYSTEDDWRVIEDSIKDIGNNVQSNNKTMSTTNDSDLMIVIDSVFLDKAINEVYQLYPNYHKKKFDISTFLSLVIATSHMERKEYNIQVKIYYQDDTSIYNIMSKQDISNYSSKTINSDNGIYVLQTCKVTNTQNKIKTDLDSFICEKNIYHGSISSYTNLILISDSFKIDNNILQFLELSCKNLILGRLDNHRTLNPNNCIYFNVTYLIMSTIGIPLEEESTKDFLFPIIN